MRVRMKSTISGDRNGLPWPKRGDVIELPDDEGADLCRRKLAEPVVSSDVETATQDKDEEPRPAAHTTKKTAGRKSGLTKASMNPDG